MSAAPRAPGEGGGAAYWGVPDIDATHADPFGNAIGLIENPYFRADAAR